MERDDRRYNILVVEDNLGDFVLISDYLEEQIHLPEIHQVQSFKELEPALEHPEGFDIILLDLSLPDHNGEALITDVIHLAKDTPIIVLTGYHDFKFSIKSLQLGVADYLLKDELNAFGLYKSIIYALERKKTLIQLDDSEKKYSNLFNLSPLPMWVYDTDSLAFLNVNNAALARYGYTREEFLNMTILDISPESERKDIKEKIRLNQQKNITKTFGIYKHIKKNKDIIDVEVKGVELVFLGKIAELVVAHDITQILSYISLIEEKNKRLSEIAYAQSHIVRAPLARILGLINLLKELNTVPHKEEELLNYLFNSATELDDVIKSIVKKTEHIDTRAAEFG